MKPIGGYFELELKKGHRVYHNTPYALKSGRSSLHYIFSLYRPERVYIPYYTCNGLLESFTASGVQYEFYAIDEQLDPVTLPKLAKNEYFLYVNYFDIKRETVSRLSKKYGDKLLVDATQAFFMKGNGKSWYFNSCRKFFGVPDGSYLYKPTGKKVPEIKTSNEKYITEHLIKRFNGHTTEGYNAFVENEILCGAEIEGISKLSHHLLSNVGYEKVAERRRANFEYLHKIFKDSNLLSVKLLRNNVPMCYPLLVPGPLNRELLYKEKIFIPVFWKEVLNRSDTGYETEKTITKNLIPLPIDHRYTNSDLKTMVKHLKPAL